MNHLRPDQPRTDRRDQGAGFDPFDPDVVVVGGGPAGSTAAHLLARNGWRVTLVDRARFPRAKACGECVNPGAVEVLRRLGLLDSVLRLSPRRLDGWRLRTKGADVTGDFGGGVHGLGISRQVLDDALLSAARSGGVTTLEGVRVERVAPAGARVDAPPAFTRAQTAGHGHAGDGDERPTVFLRLDGERRILRPRLVVGADGLRSVVSRSLGLLARGPKRRKVSVTLHVGGQGLPADRGVLDVRDGCTLGVAPVGAGRWNATVVVEAGRDGHRLKGDPTGLVATLMRARFPEAEWTVEGGPWTSGPFDWPVRRCWAPGVVLVGDAAGYFDPFTGQGIYRALRSAELAAEAAHRSLDARGPRPGRWPSPATGGATAWGHLIAYHRRWNREVRWSRWVQRGVDHVMAHPALRAPFLRRLDASGGLAGVIRVTGDAEAPATLLHPRIWVASRSRWLPVFRHNTPGRQNTRT